AGRGAPSRSRGRFVLLVAAAVLAAVGGLAIQSRRPPAPPRLSGVAPANASPGATITLAGERFGATADGLVVRFDDRTATVAGLAGERLSVVVPPVEGR